MRKKVLLLALTSLLMSLCVPAIAQQAYVKPEVFARYVIEIGDISEETMARPKGKEDYTQNVYKFPKEITIKELIFSLPCTEKNILGRLVTKEGKKTVRSIFFNYQWVLYDSHLYYKKNTKLKISPYANDSPCRIYDYEENTKLNNGTVFVKIRNSSSRLQGADIEIEYYQNVPYDMVGGNSEYVDLGLSVKWASRNVGAIGSEEIGDFYFWGETETKQGFDSELTYKFRDGHGGYTKYNDTDGKTALDPEDDVAHVKLGGSWRMPTTDEINELVEKCTWSWASVNGEIGFLITSNIPGYTDRSIFLPYYYAGTSGDVAYWSGSFNARSGSGCASLWICFDGYVKSGYCYRNWQLPVRPVCE